MPGRRPPAGGRHPRHPLQLPLTAYVFTVFLRLKGSGADDGRIPPPPVATFIAR